MRILLVAVLLLVTGCSQQERYVNQVNLPKQVYTLDVDPNDPIYDSALRPTDQWIKLYGSSERSLILYNLAALHQNNVLFNDYVQKHSDPNDE